MWWRWSDGPSLRGGAPRRRASTPQAGPLACVVPRDGVNPDVASLREHLSGRVARWQLPERWTFVEGIPRTSVGKFDKKRLRASYAAGELAGEEIRGGGQAARSR
ncbi:hypothetical protein [Streptomyces sp900116325]|uniref:AMP-binding enzyme n=1 Tax=Streptomyces sp. 900116325 TaxID=3154295 RepID=UPI00331CA377